MMSTVPSIFGNSGGAAFAVETLEFMGVLSRITVTRGLFGDDDLPAYRASVDRISRFGSKRRGIPLIRFPKCSSSDIQKSLTAPSEDEEREDHKNGNFCFHGAPHAYNSIKREAGSQETYKGVHN